MPSPADFRNLPNALRLRAHAALIDIEGTVGSIAFVRDVLFPYAEKHIGAYVRAHQDDSYVRSLLNEAAMESGHDLHDLAGILGALMRWQAEDRKVTPLKQLQGLVWAEGFASSGLRGHLYDDAIAAIRRYHNAGVRLYVYSSGSIAAQKLLFGNSVAGDLTPLFSGFYDTTIGGKREPRSYSRILREIQTAAEHTVFFSDNVHELDAARVAGIRTVQLARPEDGTQRSSAHEAVATFEHVELEP